MGQSSKTAKAMWQRPGFRERVVKAMSLSALKRWQDPLYRSHATKAARRRAKNERAARKLNCTSCQKPLNEGNWMDHSQFLRGETHILYRCGDCRRAQTRKYESTSPARAATNARYRRERRGGYRPHYNYERSSWNQRLRLYGLNRTQWEALFDSQKRRCAICKTDKPTRARNGKTAWHTDHNHTTGKVRGILCGPCNLLVAYLEKALASKAQEYIQRSK